MEDRIKELYDYLDKYEKEKIFVEAKIEVVKEMISDETLKIEKAKIADLQEADNGLFETEQAENV